jgi:hypothetical protein
MRGLQEEGLDLAPSFGGILPRRARRWYFDRVPVGFAQGQGALSISPPVGATTHMNQFCGFCGTQVVGEHLNGELSGRFLVNLRAIRHPYVNPFKIEYAPSLSRITRT